MAIKNIDNLFPYKTRRNIVKVSTAAAGILILNSVFGLSQIGFSSSWGPLKLGYVVAAGLALSFAWLYRESV